MTQITLQERRISALAAAYDRRGLSAFCFIPLPMVDMMK